MPRGATGVRLGGGEEVEKTSQKKKKKKKKAERLDPHTVTAAGQTTAQWARDSIKTNFKPQSKQWPRYSCIFSHVNRLLRGLLYFPLTVFFSAL